MTVVIFLHHALTEEFLSNIFHVTFFKTISIDDQFTADEFTMGEFSSNPYISQ